MLAGQLVDSYNFRDGVVFYKDGDVRLFIFKVVYGESADHVKLFVVLDVGEILGIQEFRLRRVQRRRL